MSNDTQFKREVEAVRQLGEWIGYGNMMDIASALWAIKLEPQGMRSGAFIPTVSILMRKNEAKIAIEHQTERMAQIRKMGILA